MPGNQRSSSKEFVFWIKETRKLFPSTFARSGLFPPTFYGFWSAWCFARSQEALEYLTSSRLVQVFWILSNCVLACSLARATSPSSLAMVMVSEVVVVGGGRVRRGIGGSRAEAAAAANAARLFFQPRKHSNVSEKAVSQDLPATFHRVIVSRLSLAYL